MGGGTIDLIKRVEGLSGDLESLQKQWGATEEEYAGLKKKLMNSSKGIANDEPIDIEQCHRFNVSLARKRELECDMLSASNLRVAYNMIIADFGVIGGAVVPFCPIGAAAPIPTPEDKPRPAPKPRKPRGAENTVVSPFISQGERKVLADTVKNNSEYQALRAPARMAILIRPTTLSSRWFTAREMIQHVCSLDPDFFNGRLASTVDQAFKRAAQQRLHSKFSAKELSSEEREKLGLSGNVKYVYQLNEEGAKFVKEFWRKHNRKKPETA